MEVQTDSERVRTCRKLVLELLGSSVDLSHRARGRRLHGALRRRPARFGPPARRRGRARRASPAITRRRGPRATVAQPVKVDNELYVRDYAKCILCYKCVEACGEDAQNTFAIAVAGRGFDARISTECERRPARLGLRLLRQLHRRLPDRRADVQAASTTCARRAPGTSRARRVTDTICPYCGVGCTLTLHVQDNEIVKVTSPLDHDGHRRPPLHQGPLRLRSSSRNGRRPSERAPSHGHRARRRAVDALRRRQAPGRRAWAAAARAPDPRPRGGLRRSARDAGAGCARAVAARRGRRADPHRPRRGHRRRSAGRARRRPRGSRPRRSPWSSAGTSRTCGRSCCACWSRRWAPDTRLCWPTERRLARCPLVVRRDPALVVARRALGSERRSLLGVVFGLGAVIVPESGVAHGRSRGFVASRRGQAVGSTEADAPYPSTLTPRPLKSASLRVTIVASIRQASAAMSTSPRVRPLVLPAARRRSPA